MRVKLAIALAAAGIAALLAASASSAARSRITMKPSTGRAHTHFVISFTAPQRTTGGIGMLRSYEISAQGPTRHGCQSSAFATVGAKRNGARVSAKLIPTGRSPWCAGAFHGRIVETTRPLCGPPARLCPLYLAVVRTIGKFTFHVRASGSNNGPIVAPRPPLPPVQPPCHPLPATDIVCM